MCKRLRAGWLDRAGGSFRRLPDVTTANDWLRILGWPGYRVYRSQIDKAGKRLKLWVRRRLSTAGRQCSSCGRWVQENHEVYEREVRDLPWAGWRWWWSCIRCAVRTAGSRRREDAATDAVLG